MVGVIKTSVDLPRIRGEDSVVCCNLTFTYTQFLMLILRRCIPWPSESITNTVRVVGSRLVGEMVCPRTPSMIRSNVV